MAGTALFRVHDFDHVLFLQSGNTFENRWFREVLVQDQRVIILSGIETLPRICIQLKPYRYYTYDVSEIQTW